MNAQRSHELWPRRLPARRLTLMHVLGALRRAVIPVALAGLVGLPLGCVPGDAGVSFSIVPSCVGVQQATERVFQTAEEWQTFVQENGGMVSDGSPVDFNRFVLAARFDGPGSACTGFTVEDVLVRDGRIEISATRHTWPHACILLLAYPQVVVAVERRGMPVVFRIADARDEVPSQTRRCP